MTRYTYLLVDLCTILVPFIFSFHPRLRFYEKWRSFIPANLITATIFLIWDIAFTKLGVWGFNPDYVLGIFIAGLPIEEYLFFICIPYACVFTYHCLELLLKFRITDPAVKWITMFLIFFLLILALFNYYRLYTASTFILCAAMLTYTYFYVRAGWLGKFYIVYSILLIPFLIVNGLLTGTGPDAPIVWYNAKHILGPRILSIPFEDVFYGMLLILLNVILMKRFGSEPDSHQ